MNRVLACFGGVVLIHNHPASKPPSYRDVHTVSIYPSIIASVVVGHDGSCWWVAAESVVATVLDGLYNELKDRYGDYAEAKALRIALENSQVRKQLEWRRLR